MLPRSFHFSKLILSDNSNFDADADGISDILIDEAVTYPGLDRIGLKAPQKAIHRLCRKGCLHPKKISGRLVFSREELDTVLANGGHKRGRGRPREQVLK